MLTVIAIVAASFLLGAFEGSEREARGDHTLPTFAQSFGFAGLVLSGCYLAAFGVWAWRRGDWVFMVRHVASAAAMLVLVVFYLLVRGGLGYNGHSWNQSFADASVILYAVTLGIGPLARLWHPAGKALEWRRETSIWATIAAALHVGIFWEWSLGWDWRPFFYPGAGPLGGDRAAGLAPTAFHVANVIGLIALAYALVLAVTSNDASQHLLRSGWTWLQKRATTMWLLVLFHTWVFAYYVASGTVELFVTLWASFWIVLLLQSAAFIRTVWRRRSPGPATTPPSSPE